MAPGFIGACGVVGLSEPLFMLKHRIMAPWLAQGYGSWKLRHEGGCGRGERVGVDGCSPIIRPLSWKKALLLQLIPYFFL